MLRTLTVALAGALALAVATPSEASPAPRIIKDVTLPAPALSAFQSGVGDDHGIQLGGVGSGIYPALLPGDYWMITDRGPNGQPTVDGEKRRTFPAPAFAPAIVRVSTWFGKPRIEQSLPLVGSDGVAIGGISNQAGHDEVPYAWDAQTVLPYHPSGVDTEDIVRTVFGDFWVVDEYGPSLLHVSRTGRVLERLVPEGLGLTGTNYPVTESLPAILASRQQNRGFEGLALSPDQRTLYLAVQSPLANPDKKTGKKSRTSRIFTFDLWKQQVTGEFAYTMEDVTTFDPKVNGDQSEMKISGLSALGRGRLLVDERTDNVARLYTIDLTKATNLLGGAYDDPATKPSLEAALPAGVTPVTKTLALDLAQFPGVPGKIEGVATLDPWTVVIANDNDFGMGDIGPDGKIIDTGLPSRVITFRLPKAL